MGEELQFCPNCKKTVSRTNFTVHNVHCQRNIIACSLCHEPVPRSQYQQHVEVAHSSIACQQCGIQVESVQLYYHQNELCLKRLIACQYCELEVNAAESEHHVDFCGARTDRCKGCTKYIQFKHLQFHYEHDHKYLNPGEKEKAEANGIEGDEDEECPVCLGPVTLPLSLECGHVFCMVCVKGIANTTKNCAICRRDIHRDMLMDIRFCREEDVIKNYVNNPKYKKTARSRSVPNRRVGTTTQEYDDMVSALLSSRTSSSNYRYQRPNNGHTPPSYTPYCYSSTHYTNTPTSSQSNSNNKTSTTSCSSSFKDDDCCCSSSNDSKSSSSNDQRNTKLDLLKTDNATSNSVSNSSNSKCPDKPCSSTPASQTVPSFPEENTSKTANRISMNSSLSQPKTSNKDEIKTKSASNLDDQNTATNYSMPPAGIRRRPTSLALQPDDHNSIVASELSTQPQHLSQEEYDRWLAFQLAKSEDEVSTSEFNKNYRSPFRRSRSMPERKEANESSVSPEDRSEANSKYEIQSRLPPTSPRCNSAIPVPSGNVTSTTATGGSNLSKSSSDSSATGTSSFSSANSAISTGARPKSSTGLKKRVSFKEDAPHILRQAPVMLPCEFCEEVFPERDLMRHQTSCDQNETKNPREYLLSRRSSAVSPIVSPTSPTSPPPSALSSPNKVISPFKPPTSPSSTVSISENTVKTIAQGRNLKTPPSSPSLRSRQVPTPVSPPQSPSASASPQISSGLSEDYYSPFNSHRTSVSPSPGTSVISSSSSDISSGISSINSSSVSTTPSTSSSASPVPAIIHPDTPTDIEVDFDEDVSAYARPRKGRLLSSAIISWRSISGIKTKERPKYARSNTAPLEVTGDGELASAGVTTSNSASQVTSINQQEDSDDESTLEENSQEPCPMFIKSKNKYPAPPPPTSTINANDNTKYDKEITKICSDINNEQKLNSTQTSKNKATFGNAQRSQSEVPKPNVFKFDSYPVMDGKSQIVEIESVSCEFCKKIFSPQKFRDHQTVCEAIKEKQPPTNHSRSDTQQDNKEQRTNIPSRHNKGPAPQPPSEEQFNKRKPVERSNSVRESVSEHRRSREFESSGRRLERACSIKETSKYTRTSCESPPRRWLSREKFYGSSLDCSAAYSGSASVTSSTTSINSYSGGHGWLSHINMIRDDVRSRRAVSSLGGTSSHLTSLFGASRYSERSSSRLRPSSLYSSRNAFNVIADAFSTAREKGRYLR